MNATHRPRPEGPKPSDLDEGLRELGRLLVRAEATRLAPAGTFDELKSHQDERFGLLRRIEVLERRLSPSARALPGVVVFRCSDGRDYRLTAHGQFVPVTVVDARDVPFVPPPEPSPAVECHRSLPEREALCGCLTCVEDRALALAEATGGFDQAPYISFTGQETSPCPPDPPASSSTPTAGCGAPRTASPRPWTTPARSAASPAAAATPRSTSHATG